MSGPRSALVTNASDFAGPAAVVALGRAGFTVVAHDGGWPVAPKRPG